MNVAVPQALFVITGLHGNIVIALPGDVRKITSTGVVDHH
jgi:hypothetical protein